MQRYTHILAAIKRCVLERSRAGIHGERRSDSGEYRPKFPWRVHILDGQRNVSGLCVRRRSQVIARSQIRAFAITSRRSAEVFQELGLVEESDTRNVLSVLIQRTVDFTIYLPPVKVR
jgi:hypothetical protein